MSDIPPIPVPGQDPWDDDLNTYLTYLGGKLTECMDLIAAQVDQIDTLTASVAANRADIDANQASIINLNNDLAFTVARLNAVEPQVMTNTASIDANQASIANLNNDVGAMFNRVNAIEGQVGINTNTINDLGVRISALEDKPEYVFGATAYMFSNSAPPATGNQIRLNNADPQQATVLDIRRVDADGADRTLILEMLTTNTLIRIQDWDNALHWYRYRVTGPTERTGADNFNVPVTWHSGAGSVANAKVNVGLLIDVATQ